MKMMMLPVLLWTCWLAMSFACAEKNERENEQARLRSRRLQLQLPLEVQLQPTKGNPFDMVFLMDESSGMASVQNTFKAHVPQLFSQLASKAPSSRAGLVGYGSNTSTTLRILHPLTDSSSPFGSATSNLVSSGNTSPGYQATYRTSLAQTMGFTKYRPFCVVLFTNEQSNGDGQVIQQIAIKSLQNTLTTPNQANARGIFVGVTTADLNVYSSYSPLALATGGSMISIDAFTCKPNNTVTEIVMGCNIAINQLSLTPTTADLTIGETHTLTITTRQRNGNALYLKPNERVIFRALNGPDTGLLLNRTTNINGTIQFPYLPGLQETTTINFQACLAAAVNVCVTAAATWYIPLIENKGP